VTDQLGRRVFVAMVAVLAEVPADREPAAVGALDHQAHRHVTLAGLLLGADEHEIHDPSSGAGFDRAARALVTVSGRQ
jgi:hypothetical protein